MDRKMEDQDERFVSDAHSFRLLSGVVYPISVELSLDSVAGTNGLRPLWPTGVRLRW